MYKRNNVDVWLVFILFFLLGIGAVMIFSTSAIYADQKYGDSLFFLKRHLAWIGLGLLGMFLAWRIDYHVLRKYSKFLILVSIGLLCLVYFPGIGRSAGGARRWLTVGGFSFQPSEIAKFALVVYISDMFVRKQRWIKEFWRGLVPILIIVGITTGLILKQPDLGTVIAMGMVVAVMLFVAGARLRYLVVMGLSVLPFFYVFIARVPYRRARIINFLSPWSDPLGSGFQIVQSFLALGSGGVFGVGMGQSRQKLFYLPAAHTDFIFSIIGEELGLLGTMLVISLFIGLIWCGTKIVLRSTDLFGHFLAVGIMSTISLQTVINIGVVTGSFPTKGLPLPFISFGGSCMVMYLVAIGVLLSIHRWTQAKLASGSSMAKDTSSSFMKRRDTPKVVL